MSSNPPDADDTAFWDTRRGWLRTRKGGWVIGEAVYNHGYSMMEDLVGKCSYFQVLVLNVTGRLPEPRLADWLEACFICLSWPDPRIWCNQIGALAGAAQTSPVAAVCAGTLAADSRLYGPGVLEAAGAFIATARQRQSAGWPVARIVAEGLAASTCSKPVIVGYARPIATGDERVEAMERVREALEYATGPHLSLAFAIDAEMQRVHDEGINLAGYAAAFLADQGFDGATLHRLFSGWVMSGVHACFAEAADRPPDSFLPLRCDDIDYLGHPPRELPPPHD